MQFFLLKCLRYFRISHCLSLQSACILFASIVMCTNENVWIQRIQVHLSLKNKHDKISYASTVEKWNERKSKEIICGMEVIVSEMLCDQIENRSIFEDFGKQIWWYT